MDDQEILSRLRAIDTNVALSEYLSEDTETANRINAHRLWLQKIRHERPGTSQHFKVGVYIRYFNQTKYENYLSYHKKQFLDTLMLCPNWEFVGFYIDKGSSTPNMENAEEWSRLLEDCLNGKVDLIITQKVSNVSKKAYEISFCARMLAAQPHPIGIYFISEDIYTLASYYQLDLQDDLFPSPDWTLLPDDEPDNIEYIGANTDDGDSNNYN